MMRALEPQNYDLLFRLVSERIPKPAAHRYGGCRPRISDELCFKGLFMRFITGAAWETIENFLGYEVSDTTLRARRDEWVKAGVFQDLMEHCVSEYDRLIGLDTTNVIIDGSNQLAPGGGPDTAKYFGSKGRLGFKWSCAVDATGMGIGFVTDAANRNDYVLLQPTLDTVIARESTATIGTLHLDRGYGYPSLPNRLDGYPIKTVEAPMRNKPNQGRVPLVGFNKRWVVERTNAWLTNFRQLKINWDRKKEHRHAMICLAFATLFIYRLNDHLNTYNLPPETIH